MNKAWILKIGILFMVILFGCGESPHPVLIKKLIQLNPTNYIFKLPVDKLRDTIIKLFDLDHQMDDTVLKSVFIDHILKNDPFPIIFSPEQAKNASFGYDYFKKPGTDNDIFLCQMGSCWYSPIYFYKNGAFLFSSSFAIKFKTLSPKETLIKVIDVDPGILNGTICCGPHGNYANIQNVKPTTVEEYTLILYIAEKLGIEGLKPLHIPR
jgi:hypothetical protein